MKQAQTEHILLRCSVLLYLLISSPEIFIVRPCGNVVFGVAGETEHGWKSWTQFLSFKSHYPQEQTGIMIQDGI